MPDPYDGLVDGHRGHLPVHDCLGCPLYVQDQPWGLLTLDSLDPASFGRVDLDNLQAFASLQNQGSSDIDFINSPAHGVQTLLCTALNFLHGG